MKKKTIILIAAAVFMLLILALIFFSSSRKKEIQIQKNEPAEDIQENSGEAVDNSDNSAETELKEVTNKNNNNASDQVQKAPEPESNDFKISDKLVNWGFQKADNRAIDAIIIHSSYNAVGDDPYNLDDIIYKEYKPYGVSPHYIISREGGVYRLVEDKNIAYHAGESKTPDGRINVNNFSIGIEIVNKQSGSPSETQYESLKNLLNFLKSKYEIKYILGHSDIAPGRKNDPWNFDWSKIK